MNKTGLKWRAYFKGQHVLEQYDSKGKERLFKEVLDRQDELEKFELVGNGEIYQVNLITGEFFIKGVKFLPATETELGVYHRDVKYRIIYYRRIQTTVSQTKVGKPNLLCYLLGWQATIDGKNIQRIMQIHSTGKLVLQTNKNR